MGIDATLIRRLCVGADLKVGPYYDRRFLYDPRVLTPRFIDAFAYASKAHAGQTRKGGSVPYIAHLMDVAAIVLFFDGTEDQAIAALLHDAPEDAGGRAMLEGIRRRFGDAVADIVDGCTDTYETPKPAWLDRKKSYIARIPALPPTTLLVAAADKLANARSVLSDHRRFGEAVWTRFQGKRDGTLWYYRAVTDALARAMPSPLVTELARVVAELESLQPETGQTV